MDYTMKKLLLVSLCFFTSCISALSNTLFVPKEVSDFVMKREYRKIDMVYYAPNEMKPLTAQEFFESISPEGSYFTVGGADRAYINGALANTSSLIIADNHPGIIAFNIINTILIRMASDPSSYRRFRNDINTVLLLAEDEIALEDSEISKTVFLETCANFWRTVHLIFEQKFEPLLSPVGQSSACAQPHSPEINDFEYTYANFVSLVCPGSGQAPFEDANFLYDETLFAKVKQLAHSVTIVYLDITNRVELKRFLKDFQARNQKISAIDISNIFPIDHFCQKNDVDIHSKYRKDKNVKFYISPNQFQQFLSDIKPACNIKAKILSTQWSKVLETTRIVTPGGETLDVPHPDWDYTFAAFKDVYLKKCNLIKTVAPKRSNN